MISVPFTTTSTHSRFLGFLVFLTLNFLILTSPKAGVERGSQVGLSPQGSPLHINEFLTANGGGIRDWDGDSPDWIEIYNPHTESISLGGYHLTDNPNNLTLWTFPDISLGPGEFQIVFASGKTFGDNGPFDPGGHLHASFRLSTEGEYLALIAPDGLRALQEWSPVFPPQRLNISYGLSIEGSFWGFFSAPTPGAPNARARPGWVEAPQFEPAHGFYEEPVEVILRSGTPEAELFYTLNGDEPNGSTGVPYSGPFQIDRSTVVRAVAYREGYIDSLIASSTYLFLSDITTQPERPEGFPSDWGSDSEVPGRVVADYEMDPRVVNNTLPGYSVEEALLDIPTLSISMPVEEFFGSSRGIYTHPKSRGSAWERACSVEWFEPGGGSEGFHVNAIAEIHGNSSRRPWRMQKHSIRLTFRSELGTAKLDFPLFGDSDVTSFNQLVLRGSFTDSWGLVSWAPSRYRPNDSQYIRDVWMKQTIRDMGQPSSHSNFAHLYINGLYWGLYNISERLGTDFFSEHFGGREQDWEIIADFGGSSPGWSRMFGIARNQLGDPGGWEALEEVLDVDNFIDYMLLHFYGDAEDWPHHNGYAAHNPAIGFPFRFFVWDQEIVLDNLGLRPYSRSESNKPGELFQLLRRHEVFRRRFMDRAAAHLEGEGALNLKASQARYLALANRIDKAIVAESARWGDTQASTPYGNTIDRPGDPTNPFDRHYPMPPNGPDYYFTREEAWLVERDAVLNHHLPAIYDVSRSNSLIRELQNEGLYSSVPRPVLLKEGHIVRPGEEIEMTTAAGVIYYTLNGIDPWVEEQGAIETFPLIEETSSVRAYVPVNGDLNRVWRALFFDDSDWMTGLSGVGYDTAGGAYSPFIGLDTGSMRGVNTSVYIRIPFSIDREVVPLGELNGLRINIRFEDGFAAWLNGSLVAQENAPLPLDWDSAATTSRPDSEAVLPQFVDLSPHQGLLQPGANILALQGLNVSLNSSDLLLSPTMDAVISETALPDLSGIRVYNGPIQISESAVMKARSFSNGEWSALTEIDWVVAVPAGPDNLTVSEIHYHPAGDPDVEFIEFHNTGSVSIALAGVEIAMGIEYNFEPGAVLHGDGYLVLVRDKDAFEGFYGPDVDVFGQYQGALSNAGETLSITFPSGEEVDITYGDTGPWPDRADGQGSSLVQRYDLDIRQLNSPYHWDISSEPGGSPGVKGLVRYQTHGGEDADGDGIPALLEAFLGTSEAEWNSPDETSSWFRVQKDVDGFHLILQRHKGAGDFKWALEHSGDLEVWEEVDLVNVRTHASSVDHEELWLEIEAEEEGLRSDFFRLRLQIE